MLVWALLVAVALPHPCTPLLVSRYSTTPVQYHIQADHGDRRYFRFQTYNGQWRKEKRLKDGVVVGAYGWTDGEGMLRLYDYTADGRGYRVVRQRSIQLNASLPLAGVEGGSASLNKVRNKYTRIPSVNSLRRKKYEKVRKSIYHGDKVSPSKVNDDGTLRIKEQRNLLENIPGMIHHPSSINIPTNTISNHLNKNYDKHTIGVRLKNGVGSFMSPHGHKAYKSKKGKKLLSVKKTNNIPKNLQQLMRDHLENINIPASESGKDSPLNPSNVTHRKRPEQYVSTRNTKYKPTPRQLKKKSRSGRVPMSRKLRSRKHLKNLEKVNSSNLSNTNVPYGMRQTST